MNSTEFANRVVNRMFSSNLNAGFEVEAIAFDPTLVTSLVGVIVELIGQFRKCGKKPDQVKAELSASEYLPGDRRLGGILRRKLKRQGVNERQLRNLAARSIVEESKSLTVKDLKVMYAE